MIKMLRELFQLLTPSQRKRFYILQVLVVAMAFSEIVGVASIAPFMALVGDMTILERENIISRFYQFSGITSPANFVFWVGVGVLVTLFLSALISMITTWQLSMFATKVGAELGDRLYTHYLKQDWLFHATGSSAQLTKKIATEAMRVTIQVVQPLMQMNARIILALFMSVAIFSYDPKVAMIGLTTFAIAYIILYKLVRKVLLRNGRFLSTVYEQRFRLMNEGFGGVKDVLLLGRDEDYIKRFAETSEVFAKSQGVNNALSQVPKYLMELVAFSGMISLVLYLVKTHNGALGAVLPIISVYALAGFKLLPAFQQIYNSVARIKGNVSAFESIREDLVDSIDQGGGDSESTSKLLLSDSIALENIVFSYPGKEKLVINQLNMVIKSNSVIGIVGSSGSGKSTLIDILLGLIPPQSGQVKIDGVAISKGNLRAWQNIIGFVPQSIFLSEGSIAENIAFGISEDDINLDLVNKALSLAHLDELVDGLESGLHTKVGERGVQLSGGQRQRIGIARALYHEAEVLVFDEATSALDGITEKLIMEAIHDFSGQKTIIMIAHRLKTVQKCDQIFFIDEGQVVDQGTYQELVEKNERFRKMAELS
ncbi:ABC transporter ATP-binding protein [Marinomonas sp. NPDC078689]|uniref:ABC transporter ATP-binding protein n=1 Tax=Marinomonas sp. NPDC078689 TaxID=3364147 RepID=UPI0037CC328E